MRMNVKESTMVRPMAETPSGSLWLSNLDLQMPATYHSRFVNLYRSNGAANFFDVGLLKAALGRVLVDFYPYAGRLEKADNGRIQINCNAEGVLFVEAECDATVDDLGGFAARVPDLSLVPKVDYSWGTSTFPLLLLQLTRFKCGSISLGFANDHHVSDGMSVLHFIKTWSDATRGVTAAAIPPLLDRRLLSARCPPQPQFPHDEYQPLPTLITPLPSTDTSHSTFKLTPAHLRALKQRCKSRYTMYEVVTGHVWRCVCAARGLAPDQETRLQSSVDGRPRLRPPLPSGFFGNVIFYTTSTALCGELVSNPVDFAAGKVHASVARMNDEYLRSAVDYLEVQLPNIPQTARRDNTMRCPNFDITSWARLPSFEADFGWGKPVYVGPAAAPYEGKCFLFVGAESDGSWLLEITLLKPHMEAFQKLFYDIPSVHENYDTFIWPRL
ncbi:rosmarinate synthase-like [Salvia miltiorrhiza]|uniref:rosmarinate synthase-like n=1 Tax=Salvia miltiorrhiza TaxID=226208 RepID=UPI0025AD2920|nr:rosmarinate synthase-like [Salvia miltiorrhiza]